MYDAMARAARAEQSSGDWTSFRLATPWMVWSPLLVPLGAPNRFMGVAYEWSILVRSEKKQAARV